MATLGRELGPNPGLNPMPKQIISASEMERYGYCPLSWYLDLRGIDAEGEEVNTGVEKHKEIGDSLKNLLVEEEKSRETSTTLMTIVGLIMTVVTIALIILWLSTDVLRQIKSAMRYLVWRSFGL